MCEVNAQVSLAICSVFVTTLILGVFQLKKKVHESLNFFPSSLLREEIDHG
jgi:hypothetical protein